MKISPGFGKFFYEVATEIAGCFSRDISGISSIVAHLQGVLHRLIPSEKVMIFIPQNEQLISLDQDEELKESSLAAFIGKSQLFQIINDTESSPLSKDYPEILHYKSICAVPLLFSSSSDLFAVAMLYNRSSLCSKFTYDDVSMINGLGLLYSGYFSKFSKLHSKCQKERYKDLQYWCKKIVSVTDATEQKQLLEKKILQNIYGDPEPQLLIKSSIDLLTSITNSTNTRLIFKTAHRNMEFESNDSLVFKDTQDTFESCPLYFSDFRGMKNCAIYKINHRSSELFIELSGKTDPSLTYFEKYTRKDESIIEKIGIPLIELIHDYLENRKPNVYNLRSIIRDYLSQLNCYHIFSTIRTASQSLLKCERGSVYLRDKDKMILSVQGREEDIPDNYKIPIGKGIIGSVAESGRSEILKDAYADPRFFDEVDKLTGFSTHSMLCVPVKDKSGQVIAGLQMLNKHDGYFDHQDQEILELFSEMVGSVLLKLDFFQKNLDERTRLVNILNSLGAYVFVLNGDKDLDYSNKYFEEFFEVNTPSHTDWIQNLQLLQDIDSILKNYSNKIQRYGEKILVRNSLFTFNYTVLALHEVSGESSGVIVILEDVTEMDQLNQKYSEVLRKLKDLIKPVRAITSLQVCIIELESIRENIDPSSDIYKRISEIIDTLKKGDLLKTVVELPEKIDEDINSCISEYNEDAVTYTRTRVKKFRSEFFQNTKPELMDWNWDVFEESDYFHCVYQMLFKFDIPSRFRISSEKLHNFLDQVIEKYEDNPYHNVFHGVSVMHSTFLLLLRGHSAFSSQDILSILIAAFCHDVGHTGFNNSFEIASKSKLAVLYNDIHVLENHHAALTFQILKQEEFNIFENIPPDELKAMRKVIIDVILSTDMGHHFRLIADSTSRFTSDMPFGHLEGDASRLGGIIVHCADLANPTKDFGIYEKWCDLIYEEFIRQAERELQLGVPQTDFMVGLDDPRRLYKNEVGFLTVIVRPLWNCLNLWIDVSEELKTLDDNIEVFQHKLKELLL